jgi:myo-inositol-1(or 4)-monophosphatase
MTATPISEDLPDFKTFAEELADLSGSVILPYFRQPLEVANKQGAGGFDPVTEADRNAELAMRERIAQRFPLHGVLGEEYGLKRGSAGLTWVLDPIDGTRAFMCGMAQWGTLIALNDGTKPVVGVLDQPYLRERWVASGGRSHFSRAGEAVRQIQTRECGSINDAVLSTTSPVGYFNEEEQARFWRLSGQAKLTRFGGDCYAYGLLAMGFIDLVIESGLKPWDVQALIPIVENAGGKITSWSGGSANEGGQVIACGDPRLHATVVAELTGALR